MPSFDLRRRELGEGAAVDFDRGGHLVGAVEGRKRICGALRRLAVGNGRGHQGLRIWEEAMSDVWKQLENYRKLKALPSGERLLLRPLTREDEESLVALFARASDQDLQYFRSDAGDPEVVRSWVRSLDLQRVFPLVAVVGEKVVGEAMLHFGEHYHRHLAWVRIFLDHDYRRQGIGTLMVRCLIDIGRRVGLQQLYAEVVLTQPQVVKAFENLGFRHEVTLEDYFVTDDGETLDMAILVFWLVDNSGVF